MYHVANNAYKRARMKGYDSMLDRFQRCPIYRASQFAVPWDEDLCARYDEIAQEDHSYEYSAKEHERLASSWRIHLNSCGKNGPMKQRLDCVETVRIKDRLYRESEGPNEKIHPSRQTRQRNNPPFWRSDEGTERIDTKTAWKWYSTSPSSSCSSWWVAPESWWTSSCWEEQFVFVFFFFFKKITGFR